MWAVKTKKIKPNPEICPSQQPKLLSKGTMSSQFDRFAFIHSRTASTCSLG